jgi:hypothetical protein
MPTNAQINTALKELKQIEAAKAKLTEKLRVEREAAITRRDWNKAKEITQKRKQLGHAHLYLVNTKRRITASRDLSGPIGRLDELSTRAETTVRNLNSLAKALSAVNDIIRILKALTGAFV